MPDLGEFAPTMAMDNAYYDRGSRFLVLRFKIPLRPPQSARSLSSASFSPYGIAA
jgi:hypothetical protein